LKRVTHRLIVIDYVDRALFGDQAHAQFLLSVLV
jgi:hypothetical protein